MNGETETSSKPRLWESRWAMILVTAIVGVLVGGFLGEPVKNFINRPRIGIEVVSIQSTTPPKSSWLVDLSSSIQHKLAMDIAGDDWVKTVQSNQVKYGDIACRRQNLKRFHEAFPVLSKDPGWFSSARDSATFFQSNRDYIRTILEYVQNFSDVNGQDRGTAENFLKQDREALSSWTVSWYQAYQEPPRNAADIIRFAGQFQSIVRDKTSAFLEALTRAEGERLIEPIPSFNVTLDVMNYGNLSTSIGPIGSLRIRPPRNPDSEIVAVLTLKSDLNKVAVFAPGQRQRLQYSAELILIPDDKSGGGPREYASRLETVHKKQFEALIDLS